DLWRPQRHRLSRAVVRPGLLVSRARRNPDAAEGAEQHPDFGLLVSRARRNPDAAPLLPPPETRTGRRVRYFFVGFAGVRLGPYYRLHRRNRHGDRIGLHGGG